MPVGIDSDAEVATDVLGFDPSCRFALSDPAHVCTTADNAATHDGQRCFRERLATLDDQAGLCGNCLGKGQLPKPGGRNGQTVPCGCQARKAAS